MVELLISVLRVVVGWRGTSGASRRRRPGADGTAAGKDGRSDGLDRGDLELENGLVADEHAAGLQRGVAGDVVVLAADRHLAFESDPQVGEWVAGGTVVAARN